MRHSKMKLLRKKDYNVLWSKGVFEAYGEITQINFNLELNEN